MEGRIRHIVSNRGFGFIDTIGLKSIFFHKSDVKNSEFTQLQVNSKVKFDVINTFKMTKAVNVEIIEISDIYFKHN